MSDDKKKSRHSTSRIALVVGFGSIALLLGGFGAWAVGTEISGAVIASGRIVVDRNRQAVQHPDGGVVSEILVKEGDTVTADQLLVRLDPTLAQSELAIVESRLFELMARRGRLEAERDNATEITFDPDLLKVAASQPDVAELVEGQKRLFEARVDSLNQSVTQLKNQQLQLENQISGVVAQKDALNRQIVLIATETEAQEKLLERGLAQTSRVLTLQREDARMAGMMGELTARQAQAMERIAEINIQMIKLQTERREQAITTLRDMQISEFESTERRAAVLTRLERLDIRAPVAGVIYDQRLFGPRSVVRPADPLMFIVPQDRPLVIEAQVPPINVNEISVNQLVVLRFPAFDMREMPDLMGQVKQISPDSFTDQQTGRPYYRTEIELPKSEMAKLAKGQVLIPGMPVESFIKTGDHSPFVYLTKPLTRYFSKAMRDDT